VLQAGADRKDRLGLRFRRLEDVEQADAAQDGADGDAKD